MEVALSGLWAPALAGFCPNPTKRPWVTEDGHQHGHHFIVLGDQYGVLDVIVFCLRQLLFALDSYACTALVFPDARFLCLPLCLKQYIAGENQVFLVCYYRLKTEIYQHVVH